MFKTKRDVINSLKYKLRLLGKEFQQRKRFDFSELYILHTNVTSILAVTIMYNLQIP